MERGIQLLGVGSELGVPMRLANMAFADDGGAQWGSAKPRQPITDAAPAERCGLKVEVALVQSSLISEAPIFRSTSCSSVP